MKIQRIVALLILVIPAFLSVYGWKLMRDSVMHYTLQINQTFPLISFILGFLLFIAGLVFVGGFIFYRDKKMKRVQKRFLNDIDE